MQQLLNLLAAIALLVWGARLVRDGILYVFGANLRQLISRGVRTPLTAVLSGVGVTALVQSSTATALIVSSFVGKGLMGLSAALAVMLGADIGSASIAVLFSLDVSWLSPLLLLCGVVLYFTRNDSQGGRVGRVLIGLGLMLLALKLITQTTSVILQSDAIRGLLESLGSDLLLEITLGAVLTLLTYSSLATVLLTATLAASGGIPLEVALGLVIGANLGSGLLAVFTTLKANIPTRQVPLGNFCFKLIGAVVMGLLSHVWLDHATPLVSGTSAQVVLFHLTFNLLTALLCIGLCQPVARFIQVILPEEDAQDAALLRPQHLDASALATPSLAISAAAREALHLADVVESMLRGLLVVAEQNNRRFAEEVRGLEETVDGLYSSIKYYMTRLSRAELDVADGKRWSDIMDFTINMEQIADVIERVVQDLEDKKIRKSLKFSDEGMREIREMHAMLMANMSLSMSVFLNGNTRDARKLLEEKARFRDLERQFSDSHLSRLHAKTPSSVETSALHLDLISDLRRINSMLCAVSYPVLEPTGALAPTRLRKRVKKPIKNDLEETAPSSATLHEAAEAAAIDEPQAAATPDISTQQSSPSISEENTQNSSTQ